MAIRNKWHLLNIFVLLVLAIPIKWAMVRHLDVALFPDSHNYLSLSENILSNKWATFSLRPIGYSLYLAFVFFFTGIENFYPVAFLIILSSFTPILLYGTIYAISNSKRISFLVALVAFYDWPSQAMFVGLLTEGISHLYCMVVALLFVAQIKSSALWKLILIGVSTTFLWLTRPAMLPLPFVYIVIYFLCQRSRADLRSIIRDSSIVIIPNLLAIFAVCLMNYSTTKSFTLSHLTGIALLNQTELIDPPVKSQNPVLQNQIASKVLENNGSIIDVGWDILEDYSKSGGSEPWIVTSEIKKYSIEQIQSYPMKYFKKVCLNVVDFWKGCPAYLYVDSGTHKYIQSQNPYFVHYFHDLLIIKEGLWIGLAIVFHLLILAYTFNPKIKLEQKFQFLSIVAIIEICAFGHAMVNGTELARYRMPVNTLYLALLVYFGVSWITRDRLLRSKDLS